MRFPDSLPRHWLQLKLPRKDWRPENVVRLLTLVSMSWFGAMVFVTVWTASRKQQGTELSPLAALALVGLIFHGVGLVAVALLLRSERRSWKIAFGFGQEPLGSLRLTIISMLVVAPAIYVVHIISALVLRQFGLDPAPQEAVELLMKSGWAIRAAIGGFAIVLAPVVEELLFRGLLFPLFRDLGWPRLAWIGTSLLFGFIHINAAAFLPLSLFGLFLAWLYAKTGNLLAPITAHVLFNLIPFVTLALGVQWET